MKKFISFILIMVFTLSFMAISVSAQCSLSVSSSKNEVLVGQNVTVTFSFTASAPVESADATVQFDNSKFEYVSISGGLGNLMPNHQGKTIKISDYGSGSTSKTYKITMTFKALAVGSGTFSVTSSDIGDANFESLGSPTGSTTVSVKEESKSNNANLSSLTGPSGCTLVPKFSKDVTSYTCTVPYSVTKFPMDWTTEDKDAQTSVTALQTLKVGENSRTVTVTAPDGTQKKYTVKVIREKQTVTPTPSAKPTSEATPTALPTATPTSAPIIAVVDGQDYDVKEVITLQLPEKFNKESYTYDSKEIETAVLGDVCLVQLFDGTRDSFFVYDKAEQKFTPYRIVKVTENKLTVLDKKPELGIELKEEHLVIGDGEYIGWTNEKLGEGYYLLNVMNDEGKTYPALYCKDDGSIQKLSVSLLGIDASLVQKTPAPGIEATPVVNSAENLTTAVPKEGLFKNIPFQYIGIAICIVLFIAIVIIVIIIIVGNNKEKKNQHDWGFEGTTGYDFSVDNNESDTQQTEDEDFE